MILVLSCAQDLTAVNIQVEIPLDLKNGSLLSSLLGYFEVLRSPFPIVFNNPRGSSVAEQLIHMLFYNIWVSTDASDESSGMSSETGFEHIEPELWFIVPKQGTNSYPL